MFCFGIRKGDRVNGEASRGDERVECGKRQLGRREQVTAAENRLAMVGKITRVK